MSLLTVVVEPRIGVSRLGANVTNALKMVSVGVGDVARLASVTLAIIFECILQNLKVPNVFECGEWTPLNRGARNATETAEMSW